ncbi:MAG TPA: hypothetical protein PKD55_09950 [Bellilinea sp.]|nr:hypothetical protein [Bellilinea sp.]
MTAKNKILAVLAVIVGVFMITIAPFLIQTSVERVVSALIKVSAQKPAYASGIQIFSLIFPVYRGLIFVGGIALILMSGAIAKGEKWTYPASLFASALPAAGGMFMFLPYISFIDGLPLPLIVSMVGLIFFWSTILMRNEDKWLRWAHFLSLTFAGMLTTHALVTGTGNIRTLMTRPTKPLFDGLGEWVLAWSAPIQWIAAIMLFIAIYLIASKKAAGWWFALIAATSLLLMNVSMQYIRLTMTASTAWDYSYSLPILAGLFIALLHPKFRAKLKPDEAGDEVELKKPDPDLSLSAAT